MTDSTLAAIAWARAVKSDLVELQRATGIPAAGAVAHMIHEGFNNGGKGPSRLAADFHNYAGIKWATDGWQRRHGGRPVDMATWEEIDGERVDMPDAFCAFPTFGAFLGAYAELLTFPRYRGALQYAGQPLMWLYGVWAGGWATDSHYLNGVAYWLAQTWSTYQDTSPVVVDRSTTLERGKPVAILDPAGALLCEGWLQDPDGPGPEAERTVVRLRDLTDAAGLILTYDPTGPSATLKWPGAPLAAGGEVNK